MAPRHLDSLLRNWTVSAYTVPNPARYDWDGMMVIYRAPKREADSARIVALGGRVHDQPMTQAYLVTLPLASLPVLRAEPTVDRAYPWDVCGS